MTTHTEGTFPASGGADYYYQTWSPETKPRAVLAIVHGFGEHSGRYMNLVTPLVEHGFAAASYDQRGHGRSPGQRGHIDRWSVYREDLACFLTEVHRRWPGLPVFLYGHSMGSLVVMDYVVNQKPADLAGLIISGTLLGSAKKTPAPLLLASKVMSNIIPTFALDLGLDTNALSRIPEVCQAYRDDPLVQGKTSARWGTETLKTIAGVRANLAGFKLPMLVIHGENDTLVALQGSRDLFAAAPSADKQIKVYPGGFHEPHNDLCAAEVAADITAWLEAHLK